MSIIFLEVTLLECLLRAGLAESGLSEASHCPLLPMGAGCSVSVPVLA